MADRIEEPVNFKQQLSLSSVSTILGLETLFQSLSLEGLKFRKIGMPRLYFYFSYGTISASNHAESSPKWSEISIPKLQNIRKFIRMSIVQNVC